MHEYETTFVIDSLLKGEEIDGIINKYERFISANGGEIKGIERWGKKRLAYEIKKRQYGYYVYVRYSGPPAIVKPLEREFRLNESILRYLTVRLDAKMLKYERRREAHIGRAGDMEFEPDEIMEPISKLEEEYDESYEMEEMTDDVVEESADDAENDIVEGEDEKPPAGGKEALSEKDAELPGANTENVKVDNGSAK